MLHPAGRPAQAAIGVAYCGYVPPLLERHGGVIDYVETPFELLRHDPSVAAIRERVPIVLHCASLSIGGTVPCPQSTLGEIHGWTERTQTPWIGEHLAFVTAGIEDNGANAQPYAPGEPYNIGYTVSPPMNERTLEQISENLTCYQRQFPVPIILENSPLYFRVPTSTMSQADFMSALLDRTDAGMLFDLAHLYITSRTLEFDPLEELEEYPLERVVEIHLSGVDRQPDGLWDDHANAAPDIVHEMLAQALRRASPRAVTLEYNWSVRFSSELLLKEIERVRRTIEAASAPVH